MSAWLVDPDDGAVPGPSRAAAEAGDVGAARDVGDEEGEDVGEDEGRHAEQTRRVPDVAGESARLVDALLRLTSTGDRPDATGSAGSPGPAAGRPWPESPARPASSEGEACGGGPGREAGPADRAAGAWPGVVSGALLSLADAVDLLGEGLRAVSRALADETPSAPTGDTRAAGGDEREDGGVEGREGADADGAAGPDDDRGDGYRDDAARPHHTRHHHHTCHHHHARHHHPRDQHAPDTRQDDTRSGPCVGAGDHERTTR